MVNPMFASKEDALYRKVICDACPSKAMLLCGECGCLIAAKVRLNAASCPLNKWDAVEAKLTQPYDIDTIEHNTNQPPCCNES
jgi:hypothetical protein